MKEEFETGQKSIKSSYFCGSETIVYGQFRAVLSIMFDTSSREEAGETMCEELRADNFSGKKNLRPHIDSKQLKESIKDKEKSLKITREKGSNHSRHLAIVLQIQTTVILSERLT